jgi:hypothetical protein
MESVQFPKEWRCPELSLADGTVIGSGALSLTARGRLDLEVTLRDDATLDHDELTITGITADGEVVNATLCAVTCTSGSRATLLVGEAVIELPARHAQWSTRRLHLRGVRSIGPTRFQDGPYAVRVQDRAGLDAESRGNIRATLTIEAGAPVLGWDEDVAKDYLQVLSVAQRVHVWAAMEEFFDGDILVRTVVGQSAGGWECTHPLIPWWPKPLGAFFEQALPRYRAERARYELDTLIWHFCRAHVEEVVDMKFISGSVFMEALKFYWAKNVGALTADVKANGLIRGFVKSTNSKGKPVLFNFEELLTRACADLGFAPDMSFIEDRNALFHTGAPSGAQRGQVNSWVSLRDDLVRLYDQMDEVLLRILGYRGPMHTWAEANETVLFPEGTEVPDYDPFG